MPDSKILIIVESCLGTKRDNVGRVNPWFEAIQSWTTERSDHWKSGF